MRGTRSARHASRAAALRGPPPAAPAGSAASRGRPRPPARAGWRPPRTQRPPSAVPRPAGGRRPPPPRRASRRRPRAGPGPATPSRVTLAAGDAELGGGQVVGRVVDVALVPLEVGCREPAVPLEGGGPLVAGLRRAGRVPLALAQHELAVLGEQPQRVDLVVEGAEERLAHRRVAPGGRVGAGDQGPHPFGRGDGGSTLGDGLVDPVTGHGRDDVEHGGVAGELVVSSEPTCSLR